MSEFHLVTTGKHSVGDLIKIIESLHTNVDAIHIREKTKSASELHDLVQQLGACGVPLSKLIINDRVDVAHVCKVGGVQLAYHSLPVVSIKKMFPNLRIGSSCHSIDEAIKAEKHGADYVLYGHIFPTQSKPGIQPKGIEELKLVNKQLTIPVIAIGGIKPENTQQVVHSGASGIAVMSGVFEANNPVDAIKAYASNLG